MAATCGLPSQSEFKNKRSKTKVVNVSGMYRRVLCETPPLASTGTGVYIILRDLKKKVSVLITCLFQEYINVDNICMSMWIKGKKHSFVFFHKKTCEHPTLLIGWFPKWINYYSYHAENGFAKPRIFENSLLKTLCGTMAIL